MRGASLVAACALLGAGLAAGYALGRARTPPRLRAVERSESTIDAPDPPPTPSVPAPIATAEPPPRARPFVPRDAPPCEGIALRGTLVADRPAESLAVIAWREEIAGIHRPGDVLGGAKLLYVARDRVWLARPSSPTRYAICQAELGDPMPVARAAQVPGSDQVARGIAQRAPNDFVVDAASRDALFDDPTALASSVRVAPEMQAGKMLGVKLAFVRPGSVAERLGLRTGDRLAKVNGAELTSTERILEIYARVRAAPHLSLEVVRNGAPMQIDYDVR